jgi:hypothetical protein
MSGKREIFSPNAVLHGPRPAGSAARAKVLSADVGSLEDRPDNSLCRNGIFLDETATSGEHAAEVLSPRPVLRCVQNYSANPLRPQFLRLRRKSEKGVGFAINE